MSEILIYQNETGNIKVDVVFEEGELDESVVVRNFRTTTQHGVIKRKNQSNDVKFYNIDMILSMNGRGLLTHAGKISHEMAKPKVNRKK